MRKCRLLVVMIVVQSVSAQELNCRVKINTETIMGANRQVFNTLEKALNDFVNKTEWTGN